MKAFVLAVLVLGPGVPALIGAPSGRAAAAPLLFSLRDTAGTVHTEKTWADARAIVMFFITPDCPISQGYVPEMNRIAEMYAARGVRFYAVQSDVLVADDAVRQHVAEFGYQFPVLLDPGQVLVRHTGATVTPEAVVITPSGTVLYQGRIDNRIAGLGNKRIRATVFDLRDALDAVLAGRRVAQARTTAYGCIISKPT